MRTFLALLAALLTAGPAPAQPATIAPGDNLVVEGVPPIPAELAEAVRRYTESRSAALVDWHPVDRAVLIRTRFGNTNQLHRVAAPMAARTQLTFFDEPVGAAS